MKQELDKALCEKYPLIFADRNGDPTSTAMCWGFECGDGWYNIIDTLCAAIQSHINWRDEQIEYTTIINNMLTDYHNGNKEPLTNWAGKLISIYLEMGFREVPEQVPQVVATQVKEKFGGLRFYYNGGDDKIEAFVTFAEMLSQRTCDVCGAPGKPHGGGWITTRCDNHADNLS